MNQTTPAIIDIEASGLDSKGYPIEVGFVDEESNPYCFLVEPERNWTYWDDEAEALHGISRQILKDYGKTAFDVAEYMNGVLNGKTLYSDAWSYDISWVGKLFAAVDMHQKFTISSLLDLLTDEQKSRWDETKEQVIKDIKVRRRRASGDAKIIQDTYRRVVSDK